MKAPESRFHIYQRMLPHWRAGDAVYFVTWRLAPGVGDLTDAERDVVTESLLHFDGARYDLLGFVVMNDHVHVLVRPRGDARLERLMHSWKSYTSHVIGQRRGIRTVWLKESFDRIVRDGEEL